MLLETVIVILLIVFSSVLSAIETAVTATSIGKVQQLKSTGVLKTELLLKLIKNKEQVISTLLIANSIINTVATTVGTSIAIAIYKELGTIISSIVMSGIIIVFAEVVPKAIAVSKAETIALLAVDIIQFLLTFLAPISYLLSRIINFICWMFNINLASRVSGTEEIRGLIEHQHQEGNVFDKMDRDMLGGVLDIKDMEVSQIMVHRSKMCTINFDLPIEEFIAKAITLQYSKIPVWKESSENIIGILYVWDLIKELHSNKYNAQSIKLRDLIADPCFIPENALVSNQLSKFKEKYSNIALVVDEYGVLQGMITRQDILEEIVGPIFDKTINNIINFNNTTYIIDGSSSIRDINRKLNWNLPDDATTIAGLIIHHIQKIPQQGDIYYLFGLKIEIDKMHAHYIQSVKVEVVNIDNNMELHNVS
ncbi:transporter associated domain protein [Orientia chuto str. Dubai]|uniref:Transporter associated domain protein n=1 Tax=Orientia chuto str. Dubai TaxID=1359168 RepID=A0A0F3MMN0_9RICK|nr:CNNM domain-containing protein [Candidatus Orientia mediorientalis]KJV56916.1 transporter associated domain protein [Orientia chuto str. Dubai]